MPKLNDTVRDLLIRQVGREMFASLTYRMAKSAWYEAGCTAAHRWAREEAEHEVHHSRKVDKYLAQRGEVVACPTVEGPKVVRGATDIAKTLLALEESVTDDWQAIHEAAEAAHDGETCSLSIRFLDEQVDGVDAARRVLRFASATTDSMAFDQQMENEFG